MVVIGLVLFGLLVTTAHTAYRFERFAAVADARILDSDSGCFGAYGTGSTGSGDKKTITYTVEFDVDGGVHRTRVKRPCDVIPPDFGRGRGSIWVQYDRLDLDRIRVLNDDRAKVQTEILSVLFGAYVVGVLTVVVAARRRRPAEGPVGDDTRSP